MKKLKLFLSLLMLIAFSVGNVWATDFTLSSAAEVTKDGITVTFAKGDGGTAPTWYAAGLRLYANNTITISCDKDITEVTFDWEKQGSKAFASVTASVGDYTHPTNAGEGTWSGTSKSITFTLGSSGQLQLNTFSVTTASGGTPTCATPTFDPEDGEKFDESIDVEINAEDGATIYYTTDGNAPTTSSSEYSTALHFTETTTLKAMAVKAGSNNSAVATATYTKMVTVPGYAIDFESELDAYVDWEFSNIGIHTSTITAHGGTYYGSNVNGNGNATTTAAIKTKAKVATPGVLTFYISKESNNSTASSWKAQVSADGSEWTEVETFDAKSMSKGAWNECTADLSEYSNVYVRIYYEGSNAIRAIDDIELAMASAVAKPAISGETPFLTSTMVTLTQAEADHIYYTTNGNEPTTSSTEYTVPFELNATATVKAIAVKGSSESAVAEATFTKITPLTVAEAIAAIPNVDDVVNSQYVAGIVCTAGTSVNASGQMTYYISADGSEGTRLQIYLGKNINNTAFSSASDLAIGDRVVVFGQLKNYKGTYEMNSGNYLVSKEGPAVATPVFDPNGGGFMGETDVTITCATDGSTIYYTLDGTNPTKLSTLYEGAIHLDATTTITAIAYVGEESSLVVAKEFTLTAPMTVAEALAALDSEDPINNVAVAGIISTAPTSNPNSGKLTYYISGDGTDTDELEVFLGFGLNGASFSNKTDLQVGDEVTVFGNLTIFNSTTKEFASGSRLLAFNRPEVAVTSIDLTESIAEVEVGKTVTLHASVVPANATNKTIVWSVQSGDDYASVDENGVVTGIAAGEAVIRAASDENASIYEECSVTVTAPTPLSPWASVYTSNVTLSTEGGTSASAAKVKFYGEEGDGYDAIKAGTGSAQGAVVVNVPAGATTLHFHAYGWNSESVGLTVTAPTGVTVSPATEISINSNSGIASNSPFTLAEGSDPKTDAYYTVSLSGNTEATNITISATSGKRFVLFGVNQEGGLVLESIAISGTASVLEYNDGDNFDPAGLVVTGHYSNGSDAPISEGIDWTFDPDPLTEGTESVSVTATVGEISSIAFVVNGLTVHGAAPLSPWATTWTSNLDDITGSKVKFYGEETEYAALKAGTGSVVGTATLNIPAQATELHFHAYGWNSEDVTLSITAPDGVTVTPASINLNSNSGFASNSPFTLAEGSTPQTDAYYALSLRGNTDAIELTISATEGKRFLLFGVNQVGGVLPELQSIAISGDLDNKSYKAGQALDMTGLTVNATYTLGGTPQTPVDVTNDPGLTWTYDPLVENQDEVTVTAHFGDPEKTASKTIEGLTVTTADPAIYVDPSLYVNFGSVDKDAALPADQTITVTLTNVAAGTATLAGADVFNIDKTALVEGENVITISVASTATAGEFSATITLTDNASAAPQKVVNLSFTVNEPVVEDDVTGTWTLVTNATTLAAGKKVIIAQYVEADGAINTMAGQSSNNRSVIASTVAGVTLTPAVGTKVMTLANAGEGKFYLMTSDDEYLYNASTSSKSYLRTKEEADDASWTIAVTAEGVATIASVVNTNRINMRYNENGSNPALFNCYATGQNDIALYMLEEDTPEPTADYTRSGLTVGNYATICLPNGGTISGATLFDLDYYDGDNTLYLLEVNGNAMVAGRPYVFLPSATSIEVTYTDNANEVAGSFHGLVGSYTEETVAIGTGDEANYILYQNAYYLVNSQARVGANRAYIHMADVPTAPQQQQGAPRRRVAMSVHGEQVATGIDALNASDAPVKVLINGQLFIIRGEKMFDAKGQLVK